MHNNYGNYYDNGDKMLRIDTMYIIITTNIRVTDNKTGSCDAKDVAFMQQTLWFYYYRKPTMHELDCYKVSCSLFR